MFPLARRIIIAAYVLNLRCIVAMSVQFIFDAKLLLLLTLMSAAAAVRPMTSVGCCLLHYIRVMTCICLQEYQCLFAFHHVNEC